MDAPQHDAVLRATGLRVTPIRVAVMESLAEQPHAEVEVVRAGVAERLGSVSVQSVYDTLALLRDRGILRRLEPAGHPARYEINLHDNHHHMICRVCARVQDVPCVVPDDNCQSPGTRDGFAVDEVEVIFWGTCEACTA